MLALNLRECKAGHSEEVSLLLVGKNQVKLNWEGFGKFKLQGCGRMLA